MNDTTDDDAAVDARIKPAPGPTEDEQILWSATPGQIQNLHIYVVAVIAAAVLGIYAPWPWVGLALIPLTVAGVYAAALQATRYELTSQRLRKQWGLLTRRGEEVELYRVEDTNPTAPLLYRFYGRGNVEVLSTNRTNDDLMLKAIKNHERVRNRIREHVETTRRAKGTRVVE